MLMYIFRSTTRRRYKKYTTDTNQKYVINFDVRVFIVQSEEAYKKYTIFKECINRNKRM